MLLIYCSFKVARVQYNCKSWTRCKWFLVVVVCLFEFLPRYASSFGSNCNQQAQHSTQAATGAILFTAMIEIGTCEDVICLTLQQTFEMGQVSDTKNTYGWNSES